MSFWWLTRNGFWWPSLDYSDYVVVGNVGRTWNHATYFLHLKMLLANHNVPLGGAHVGSYNGRQRVLCRMRRAHRTCLGFAIVCWLHGTSKRYFCEPSGTSLDHSQHLLLSSGCRSADHWVRCRPLGPGTMRCILKQPRWRATIIAVSTSRMATYHWKGAPSGVFQHYAPIGISAQKNQGKHVGNMYSPENLTVNPLKKWWLEDNFLFDMVHFQVTC